MTVDLFHHHHFHVTLAVTWEVEMFSSSLHISIHISTVLAEPFFQGLAGLANVLLRAPGHITANGMKNQQILQVKAK